LVLFVLLKFVIRPALESKATLDENSAKENIVFN